ncbi:hypothetical protein N7523_007119 [Penicillium sp. IBT 18751x]|nr:hypothetical protein N7523_007119 [Penicillium sp. IBT 18751x]
MTQSTSHRRSPSSHASKPKSRPILHRRGTSAVSLSISKLGSGHNHARGVSRSRDDDADFDMAASFLNFCAMCEKQITVPSNTVLYCSESCRRKDSCKPLSASMPSMTNMSSTHTTSTPPTSPPLSPRTIVAPMTPTRFPSTSMPSIRIPTEPHDSKTDLDPTEWKPVLLAGNPGTGTSLASSDAWNYLSRFHGGSENLLARRARSAASLPALVGGAPSMTTTVSEASSYSSTASDYLGMYEQRPLPPRHNPYFSSSAVTKSVELVVPHIVNTPDVVAVEMSDSGSIFPASSAVWDSACEKATPLTIESVQARAQKA